MATPANPRSTPKYRPARWGIAEAAKEFGADAHTISRELRAQSQEPGEDGKFSTRQICNAIFGDLEKEKLLLTRKQREEIELDMRIKSRELVEVAVVEAAWEAIVTVCKGKLLGMTAKVESQLGLAPAQTKIINAEIDEVLTQLSQPVTYAQAIEAATESTGGEVGAAATP